MKNIIEFLLSDNATSTLVLLSLTISLGLLIGSIRIKSFSIGVIAILFTGMFFGLLCKQYSVEINSYMSNVLKDLGLVLFIYTVGLQVGPSFFTGLKKGGVLLNLQAVKVLPRQQIPVRPYSYYSEAFLPDCSSVPSQSKLASRKQPYH